MINKGLRYQTLKGEMTIYMMIRQLKESDYKNYRQLRLEALQNHPEAFASSYEEESLQDDSFYIDRLNQKNSYAIGAFDETSLVGIAVCVPQTRNKIRHIADIYSVYVTPQYRKKNIAYQMIQSIIKYAEALGYIEQMKLSVTSTNVEAIKLYQRCGFQIYGLDPKVIRIHEQYFDSILMIKYLK